MIRIIFFLLGIILILLASYLWKKGDPKVPFWEVLTDFLFDIMSIQLFNLFSSRTWAVLLWLIGFAILIVVVIAQINS
ncbi:hypothetical protein ACFY5J_00595 [Peribacillus butanolivorans]|uniref:hypothetical protein n=1 Tax=Peribacillus butanolivorans TaxID=421767 RepID=UPI0036CB57AB